MTPIDDDTAVLPRVAGDEDERDDGLAAELAKVAPRRWWNRGTLVLAALVLVLGGFLGGALVQRHWGGSTVAANRPAGFGAGQNRAGGAGGYPGFAGGQFPGGARPTASAPAAGTTGTVKLVDGSTVYLQTADGSVVTVKMTGRTTVRIARTGALKDVKAGDRVTVQGGTGSDGTVTATSVTADR